MTGFKAGQNVPCRIVRAEGDGYVVTVEGVDQPGFLKTPRKLQKGDKILGVFVCVTNGRILLSQLFEAPRTTHRWEKDKADWGEHLSNAEDLPEQPHGNDRPDPPKRKTRPHKPNEEQAAPTKSHQHLSVVPQDKITVLPGGGGGSGSIFRYKRSTDVFVPPVDLKSIRAAKNFKVTSKGLQELIEEMESLQHSGCIKVSSEGQNSRAAALLYAGRVVGCTFSCKNSIDALSGEEAVAAMLASMQEEDCAVNSYTLPTNVVLPMAALFLGQPVERKEHVAAVDYYNMVTNYVAEKDHTACITLIHPNHRLMHMVLFFRGQAIGIFAVDTQKFTHNIDATAELFEKYEDTIVDTCIVALDDPDGNAKSDLGYSLTDIYSRLK